MSIEWLEEEIAAKSASSLNNGCVDCGIAANNLQGCLDEIERLRTALREIKEGEYTEATMKWIAEEALGE